MSAAGEWVIINGGSFKCDNCDEIFSILFVCQECDQTLCADCNTVKHKNKKLAGHQIKRKTNSWQYYKQYDQVKEFRHLMFGSPDAQGIENCEFIVCSDKLFTMQTLQVLYKECKNNPTLSMLKFLTAEVRDACRLKEEFDKVLCQTHNVGCLESATTNDFIICLMDACKHISQKQTIFECLARFDYPVVLGHKFCGLHVAEQEIYGLHLSELNHLMFCGMIADEASHKQLVLLSIGTEGSRDKTTFLNTIWRSKFEKWSQTNGVHHEGQLELLVGTESSKRNQHILDLHGSVKRFPLVVLQALFRSVDLVLFHCNAFDFNFNQQDLNEYFKFLIQTLQESNENANLVLVIQEVGKELLVNHKVKDIVMEIVSKSLNTGTKFKVHVVALTQDWQEKKPLLNYHSVIKEIIDNTTPSCYPLQRLYDSLNSIDHLDLSVTKTTVPHSMHILRESARNIINQNEETCSSWFPLHENSSKIAYLDDKQYEGVNINNSIRQEIENMKKLRVAALPEAVKFFRDEIASKDSFDDTALAFALFQQELNRKFQPIISKCRKQLKELKEDLSSKPLKEQKLAIQTVSEQLISNDIAGVHFIRELIERSKDKIDSTASKGAVNVCQSELLIGRSIEIVNGDSLTIARNFLQDVFEPIFQAVLNVKQINKSDYVSDNDRTNVQNIIKFLPTSASLQQPDKSSSEFVSLTVIGVESSGKSTLWNELWNSNFPVAHGKCSRGFWSSLVQVKNGPILLVNDTEGILSPLCVKPRFDQKLVLLAFALSHIVIINVRGEGDNVLINLLKLVIYAAHKLFLFHRPQIVFVHRDVMGQRDHEQGSFKNNLLVQLREACEAMEQSGDKIVLENIIDTSQIHSFDLPSAIIEPRQEIAGIEIDKEERTAEFIIRCRELRQSLIQMARDMKQDESRQFMKGVSGDYGWISYANHVWDLAKQNASLWTFASVNEKLQRKYIEKQLDQLIYKHVSCGLRQKSMEKIEQLMSNDSNNAAADEKQESTNFPTFLTQLELEYQAMIEKELKDAIHEFPGSTIPADIVFEYIRKAKRIVSDAAEEQRQILAKKQQGQRLQNSIKLKFLEVSRKIELLDKKSSEKDVEEWFNTFVKDAIIQMEAIQKQRDIGDKQISAHECYCSLNSQLKYPFAREFVNACGDLYDVHEKTAIMLNDMFWSNLSSRTSPISVQKNFHDINEVSAPSWVTCMMPKYTHHPTLVIRTLYGLQDTIYRVLWTDNMKNPESVTNEWQQLIKHLCFMVDKDFVAPLYEQGKSTYKEKFYIAWRIHRTQSLNTFTEGYLQSLTNSMHTFACMMFRYFLKFQHNHEVEVEKQKFHDYCDKRKKEVMLRARHAQSATDAAKTTAEQLIYKIVSETNQKAVKDIEENLQLWMIKPEELINEAIEITFRARNADKIFDYIIDPVKFIKQIFCQRFFDKVKALKLEINYNYFDNNNPTSYLNATLAKLKKTIDEWEQYVTVLATSTKDTVCTLFHIFKTTDLWFLDEIRDSVLKYLDNTRNVKNIFIDPKQFVTELQNQLGKCAILNENIKFNFPASKYNELFEELWPRARGCEELCPYCIEKCCGGPTHIKHYCDLHLLQAFRGWRRRSTQNASLRICSDPLNFSYYKYAVPKPARSQESVEEAIPFADHVQRFNSTWNIVPKQNDIIDDDVKFAWIMLRERLGQHFNYKTTTPMEWEIMYASELPESAVPTVPVTNDTQKIINF